MEKKKLLKLLLVIFILRGFLKRSEMDREIIQMGKDGAKINREQRKCNISFSNKSYVAICGSSELNMSTSGVR